MTDAAATPAVRIHNSTFSAILFSTLGWALFLAWSIKVKAGYGAQLLPALVGIILVALAVRRYRLHWPSSRPEGSTQPGQQRKRLRVSLADAFSLVLMITIGYVIAQLVFIGSTFLLLAFAFGASLVPWSRIPFCRNRFLVAVATVFVATALPLLITHARIDPFHLLFAAWALASVACMALVFKW